MNRINQRIQALRQAMAKNHVDAYIIPSQDPHQSEYVADRHKSREWIGGFTGSAGTAMVTQDHAGVWTDSRYFLQATQQLQDTEFEMHKFASSEDPSYIDYVIENLAEGSKVGIDGTLFSKGQVDQFKKQLKSSSIEIIPNLDLIEEIWEDRPPFPKESIFDFSVEYAGKSRKEKIGDFREYFQNIGADYGLLTSLDNIAWISNLRGSDVECNPVFIAYAVVDQENLNLFVDQDKVDNTLRETLEQDHVVLHDYFALKGYLNNLPESESMVVSVSDVSHSVYKAINCEVIHGENYVRNAKAIKNETEINHFYKVMEKDAVAILRMYRWLEKTLKERGVKETEIADQLAHFRSQLPHYVGESFSAIVGFKGNGAIIHYHAEEDTCATISGSGMLLVDSGGQYLDGTTDITRTIYLGDPGKEEKKAFTLVMKGMIALDKAIFPKGTRGNQLDTLARMFLWNNHMNYGHGTGHGVGFFMNVHEPPQGFAPGLTERAKTIIKPGMVSSNEPGFYKTDAYGIRLENLIVCVESKETDSGQFLTHDTMTLFPIELKLIDETMVDASEKAWLNQYHQKVYDRVSPHLNDEEKLWLEEKCKPLN